MLALQWQFKALIINTLKVILHSSNFFNSPDNGRTKDTITYNRIRETCNEKTYFT